MMLNETLIKSEIDRFVKEAHDDYIGLWQIVRRAKRQAASQGDIKMTTLAMVKGLLDCGLMVGNLTKDGGFEPWGQQDLKAVGSRIQQEWLELGHDPTIDDIAWLQLPR